jgi:hypothetical protein
MAGGSGDSGVPGASSALGIAGAPAATGAQSGSGVPGGPGASSGRTLFTASTSATKLGLADATVAILIYNAHSLSTDSFDCSLATEAMSVAALSLGYGTKAVSSPSISLSGANKACFYELLQVPEGYSNVTELLIGHSGESVDATTSASTRYRLEDKVKFID